MPYYLSPIGNDQQCDANGNPFVGGKIFTYLAGTSTAAATYTDSTSGTSQANPIILNSLGLPASPIWMLGGQPLKFIIQDSTGVLIRTIDNVSGVNDITSLSSSSEWISSGFTPTFISSTSFSVVGDKTSILHVGRRVQTTNSGGTVYSTILTSTFATGITTVTVTNDSSALDAGLSVLLYAMLDSVNPSVPAIYAKDALVVHNTGAETVAGVKTLSNTPVLSAGATFGTATMANPSGTAPVFGARAWCVFDGTLTGTNAPTAGGNITSITRNSAGNYTVNFTTAMPDANYAVMVCGASTSSVNFTGGGSRAKSTTSFTLDIGSNGTGSAIPSDRTSVELIIFR
jgi:hypothetical protein